jgi:hypothetical protein
LDGVAAGVVVDGVELFEGVVVEDELDVDVVDDESELFDSGFFDDE